jgi:hypothetical protein
LYVPTSEVIGILPIPPNIRDESNMASYHHPSDRHQKHWFVASMQNTRKPVLPIHTTAEYQLFHSLKKSHPAFSPQSGEPQWTEAVKEWNRQADQRNDVYYKVRIVLAIYSSLLNNAAFSSLNN